MVFENELLSFGEWLPQAASNWAWVTLSVMLVAAFFGSVGSLVRYGPAGNSRFREGLFEIFLDLVKISPRRTFALARLASQEALHRRVLVAFGVFILIMLFAGWYLNPASDHPARLYLSFVLTATTYLALMLALFLSVFSLPEDIRSRTISTVVTKPVRASELVLGRIIGFSLVGTALLFVTGVISYVFVIRGLAHTHEFAVESTAGDGEPATGGVDRLESVGSTSRDQNHRHDVFVDKGGNGYASFQREHRHVVRPDNGDQYEVGPAEGLLVARVPVYGRLSFRDRTGQEADQGISVGKEWAYRSYIEGGTLAAARWRFQGLSEEMFPHNLPLELNIRVFRTHKGNIQKTVLGSLVLRNPTTGRSSSPRIFRAREFEIDQQIIDLELTDSSPERRPIHVFRDLVSGGELEIVLQCAEHGQFFGVAQPDLYLKARDASFFTNFIKGYVCIWLQMVLITTFGVMFSTILNGAVALMATVGVMVGGFFTGFISDLAANELYGGGPLEALVRLMNQHNVVAPLERGLGLTVIELFDSAFQFVLGGFVLLWPDFTSLSGTNFVANGFDIPSGLLLQHGLSTLGYAFPAFVIGYVLLKSREVAR